MENRSTRRKTTAEIPRLSSLCRSLRPRIPIYSSLSAIWTIPGVCTKVDLICSGNWFKYKLSSLFLASNALPTSTRLAYWRISALRLSLLSDSAWYHKSNSGLSTVVIEDKPFALWDPSTFCLYWDCIPPSCTARNAYFKICIVSRDAPPKETRLRTNFFKMKGIRRKVEKTAASVGSNLQPHH